MGALLLVLACMIWGEPRAHAQGTQTPTGPTMGSGVPGSPVAFRAGATIHVTILDENKKPLKQQSLVRVTSQTTGAVFFQTTSAGEAKFTDLPAAKYLIEVGASGYFAVHEQITITDIVFDSEEKVSLVRDPAAVDLKLKDAGQLPSKARKEAEKGALALELSNFTEASKHLEAANHLHPASSSINFLLGYLALQQKDQDHALLYLTAAIKLDASNVQAQNLLGQIYYKRGDYARAIEAEQIVIASQGQSLIARNILANSYLKLRQYEKARENSQWMVDRGGSEGASARLVLGQALAGLQKYEAAIETLMAYLDGQPGSAVAPQVRQLLTQLERQVSQGANANIAIGDPELSEESEALAGTAGMPLDIDAQKPSVAAGVQCPADILQTAANPSKQLLESLSQFSAIEHMVHENLSPQGTPKNRQTRQFNYVVSIGEPAPGALIIQEYRDSAGGDLDMPDKITTTGLPVLAIAFHPLFRDDFEMHCEGLGDWSGQPAWLVHFRQIEERPSRLRRYVVNKNNYPVRLKGRAWIQADNLQIVHLETDLVRGIPEINLMTEHTSVTYGPVQFKRRGADLWLPQNAELYVHFAKRRFHRSESFDHFMLFATDAVDKAKLPQAGLSQSPPPSPAAGSRP